MRIFYSTLMVGNSVLEKLRMRRLNTKGGVLHFRTLAHVWTKYPEHWISIKTRKWAQGEKCRPLDHMRQIPFIHSVRLYLIITFYIYRKVYQLFFPCGRYKWFLVRCVFVNYACALAETLIQGWESLLERRKLLGLENPFISWSFYMF